MEEETEVLRSPRGSTDRWPRLLRRQRKEVTLRRSSLWTPTSVVVVEEPSDTEDLFLTLRSRETSTYSQEKVVHESSDMSPSASAFRQASWANFQTVKEIPNILKIRVL